MEKSTKEKPTKAILSQFIPYEHWTKDMYSIRRQFHDVVSRQTRMESPEDLEDEKNDLNRSFVALGVDLLSNELIYAAALAEWRVIYG